MSPNEIEAGKSYHNGKVGPRSYSERKVLEIGARDWAGRVTILYEQVKGPYKGKTNSLSMVSFASWAKGVVE